LNFPQNPSLKKEKHQSIEELNDAIGPWLEAVDKEVLRDFCESRSERFGAEKPRLKPWVPEADPKPRITVDLMVSREGLVSYQTNRYSLPAQHIGKMIRLEVDPLGNDATIFLGSQEIRRFTLHPPGARKTLRVPADEASLRERWQRENRPNPKTPKQPDSLEPKASTPAVEVEERSPGFYDQFEGRSA